MCSSKWRRLAFDDFVTLRRGKDLTRAHFRLGSVPVAGSNGVIGYHDVANVVGPAVIVGRSGSVGSVHFYSEDIWAHNTALFVTDFHGNDPLFVSFFLRFLNLGRFGSGASVPTLDRNAFKTLPVTVPDIDEQRQIAAVLNLTRQAIHQQDRMLDLMGELKMAALRQLFTHGLNDERLKQTGIGPIPESWDVVTLGSVAKVGNGSTPKRGNAAYWEDGSISWLNSSRIHDKFITEPDQFVTELAVKECHLPRVQPGSLLIAITGQGKTLGNSALVRFETCINQHLAYAQFTSAEVIPEFVLWFLQTRYDHLRSVAQAGGSTKGALTCGYLKTYPLPLPSLAEQRTIAEVLNAVENKQSVHQCWRRTFVELFETLLHAFMTAQIRPAELDTAELQVVTAG
jgi:type I restriction enzyme S subunit